MDGMGRDGTGRDGTNTGRGRDGDGTGTGRDGDAKVDTHSEMLSVTTFDPEREADSAGTYVYKVSARGRVPRRCWAHNKELCV